VPAPGFVVDASVVVRWLVDGPFSDDCQAFLDRCGARDARLLAPTCLYSEAANALYHLCLARPPLPTLLPDEAIDLVRSLPSYEIALVDRVHRTVSGDIALTPQWEQALDGSIRDYRPDIYARDRVELPEPTWLAFRHVLRRAGRAGWNDDVDDRRALLQRRAGPGPCPRHASRSRPTALTGW